MRPAGPGSDAPEGRRGASRPVRTGAIVWLAAAASRVAIDRATRASVAPSRVGIRPDASEVEARWASVTIRRPRRALVPASPANRRPRLAC